MTETGDSIEDKVWQAFERDVPPHQREDAITAMAEATSGWGTPANVRILEHDRIDAINCRAHGIIIIEGREYVFQMQDGNWNGTELLSWNEDRLFERHEPTRWALQPLPNLVDDAILAGRGPFLIAKWDIMLSRDGIAEIVRSYAYDRYVQPGGQIESHYREKAAKHHFEIVLQETADQTRARLRMATAPTPRTTP